MYAQTTHVSTRVVCIFHARWVILTMSGLRSSFMRKWLVTGMPSPMLKITIIKQNSPRAVAGLDGTCCIGLAVECACWWLGEYKLYHSVWEPPIMCVAWEISRFLDVDNESIPLKMLFNLYLKIELWHLYKSLLPSTKGLSIYFYAESSSSYQKAPVGEHLCRCMYYY